MQHMIRTQIWYESQLRCKEKKKLLPSKNYLRKSYTSSALMCSNLEQIFLSCVAYYGAQKSVFISACLNSVHKPGLHCFPDHVLFVFKFFNLRNLNHGIFCTFPWLPNENCSWHMNACPILQIGFIQKVIFNICMPGTQDLACFILSLNFSFFLSSKLRGVMQASSVRSETSPQSVMTWGEDS